MTEPSGAVQTEGGSSQQGAEGQQGTAGTPTGDRGASQDGQQEGSSAGISRRIGDWLRGGGRTETVDAGGTRSRAAPPEPATEEPQQEGAATAKAERAPPQARRSYFEGDPGEQLLVTREEMRRAVQSEKDRQIAAENRRNADLAQVRATAAQYDRLRELADPNTGDPDRLMEAVNELLQGRQAQLSEHQRQAELTQNVRATGNLYDEHVVQPILGRLPEAVARRIVDESPAYLVGAEHRAYIVDRAIEALTAQITEDVTQRVRGQLQRSDSFRKDVLHEATDRRPEPTVVEPAPAASAVNANMNDWLRRAIR